MQQKLRRHSRLIGVGIFLLIAGAVPVIIGMVLAFQQLQRGEPDTATGHWIGIAFHPVFIATDNIGLLLITIGVISAFRRGGRPVA
jgi:hypothetical protein